MSRRMGRSRSRSRRRRRRLKCLIVTCEHEHKKKVVNMWDLFCISPVTSPFSGLLGRALQEGSSSHLRKEGEERS